jgi:sugar/nucleoside kinase (ribokinase family)
METPFVVAGTVSREYILPPVGPPLLDVPGGGALYACGGVLAWHERVGLLSRVGEDYPRQWFTEMRSVGVDTSGVKILEQVVDLRSFHAYDPSFESTQSSPVAQFARRQLTFPKALLGYQPAPEDREDPRKPADMAPSATEIPAHYREARAAHLCPLDFVTHNQLAAALRAGSVTTITVDPSPGYMHPGFLSELRVLLGAITAFLPSENELRALFWGQTYDLWEMLEAVGSYGCEVVVAKRGAQGQSILDTRGKHKWEVPAYPARLADPTCVGDAYCGGFLVGFKKTYDPLQGALHGNVSASLALEGSGAFYPVGVMSGLAAARLDVLQDLAREV